jgi:hypothetical protein
MFISLRITAIREVLCAIMSKEALSFYFLLFIKFKTVLMEESLHDDNPLKKQHKGI